MRHGPASGVAPASSSLIRRLRCQSASRLGGSPSTSSGVRKVRANALVASSTLLLKRVDSSASSVWTTLKRSCASPSSPTPLSSASRTSACDDALLAAVERRPLRRGLERLQRLVERLALAQPDVERDDLRLHRLVRRAQGVAVVHAHQVADRAPGERQALVDACDRLDGRRPRRRCGLFGQFELGVQLGQERADAGHDVLGGDAGEARWRSGLEEGIRCGVGHGLRCSIGVHLAVATKVRIPIDCGGAGLTVSSCM